jgi:hypothetical protein
MAICVARLPECQTATVAISFPVEMGTQANRSYKEHPLAGVAGAYLSLLGRFWNVWYDTNFQREQQITSLRREGAMFRVGN